jgi:hypothetical protein
MCWFCYWGWPQPVADIFNEAKRQLGGNDSPLLWGPAHIVWEDENFDSAEWCLETWEGNVPFSKYEEFELDVVRESLEKLVLVPKKYRKLPGEWEDDVVNSPPPADWVMEHV